MASAPQAEFRAHIALLRDQLVRAVAERQGGTLQDGLASFELVARALLRRGDQIDRLMAGRPRVGPLNGWLAPRPDQELGAVGDAMWSVARQAVDAGDLGALITILESNTRLLSFAVELDKPASFNEMSSVFVGVAHDLLRPDAQASRIEETFSLVCLRLRFLWQSLIAKHRQDVNPRLVEFGDITIKTMTGMARVAVDRESVASLRGWAPTYARLFEFAELPSEPAAQPGLARLLVHRQVGYLALRAWIVQRTTDSWSDTDRELREPMLTAIAQASSPRLTWAAAVANHESALQDSLGFHWWEMEARGEQGGAVIVGFESYFRQAVVTELAERPEALEFVPIAAAARSDAEIELWGSVARLLVGALNEVPESYDFADDAPSVRRLRQRLDALIEADETRRRHVLAAAELDPERVRTFSEALRAEALDPSRLINSGMRCSESVPASADATSLFGLNLTISKHFFTQIENVYADPNMTGQQLGRSLLVGLTDYVLNRFGQAASHVSVGIDSMASEVDRAANTLRSQGLDASAFVFDLEIWTALRAAAGVDEGPWSGGYDRAFKLGSATCSLINDTSLDGVLVADLRQLGCLRLLPLEGEPGTHYENERLLIDVARIDEARARTLAEGGDPNLDDEVLRIQGLVQVRALVRPWVEVRNPAAGYFVYKASSSVDDSD